MQREARNMTYQRHTTASTNSVAKRIRKTGITQILCSLILFVFCAVVSVLPGTGAEKIKNGIRQILTQTTDLKTEAEKVTSLFAKEEALTAMNPVSAMIPPSSGKIVKGFGVQDASTGTFHYGVDISTEQAQTVVAVSDGEVTDVGTNQEYGSFMILRHNDEIFTLYGRVGEILPNIGDRVQQGQTLAKTAESTVYFELRRGDTYLDPTQFIQFSE